MAEEEEEVPQCPLCLEELDATDRAVEACQCGYQICLWCLHHIREQLNSRCPACRTPYQEQNFKYAQVNPEEAAKEAKERATAKKERERREKMKEIEKERARAAAVSLQKAKSNLKHARILQKNLVYIIGLSLTLAREEVIRRADMFGKFGRMLRILVNRCHPFNADAPGGPSISAYVQYVRDSDASAAVRAMNNAVFDGREIRCAIATTKYCDSFVRNAATTSDPTAAHYCGNQNCMYFHSLSTEETLTREEVLARQLGPPPPAHLFLPAPPNGRPINAQQSIHPRLAAHSVASGLVPAMRPSARPPIVNSSVMPSTSSANPSIHPPSSLSSVPIPSTNTSIAVPKNPNNSTGNISSESASPRQHLTSETGANLRPESSPNRTPPESPRNPRRPGVRLQRSPPSRDNVSSKYARSTSTSTSSKPLTTSVPLPSTAGWASSQAPPTARSSPRHGQTTLGDVPTSRPRLRFNPRHSREPSPPPGFENRAAMTASVPSKPPGFDIPVSSPSSDIRASANSVRPKDLTTGTGNPPSTSALPPPPGFGPAPVTITTESAQGSENDVAAAWAQEAASDKVFSTDDKRSRTDFVGSDGRGNARIQQDNPDSRSELAQVLAKIGGDLGVSSEFKSVHSSSFFTSEQTKRNPFLSGSVRNGVSGKMVHSETPASLGSLFGNHATGRSYPVPSTPVMSTTVPVNSSGPPPSAAQSSVFSTAYRATHRNSELPIASPRRNTSRFGFAQREITNDVPVPRVPRPVLQARSAPFQVAPQSSHARTSTSSDMFVRPPASNEPHKEPVLMNELLQSAKPTNPLVPGASRQNRSRFDFADHGSPPLTANYRTRATPAAKNPPLKSSPPVPRSYATHNDPIASIAQLSTQEKLASIFNSAQMSGEALPPMPSFDAHIDPLANSNMSVIPSKPVAPNQSNRPFRKVSNSANVATEDKPRVTSILQSRQPLMPPPGFREATPGISPESTTVDGPSTNSGVAKKSVASGGEISTTKKRKETAPQVASVDEALSSGTDSHEGDRRRAKAQKKREKKIRQQRDSTERNHVERKQKNGKRQASVPAVQPVQVTQPVKVTQPHHTAQTGKATLSVQQPHATKAVQVKATKPPSVERQRASPAVEPLRPSALRPPTKSKRNNELASEKKSETVAVAETHQKSTSEKQIHGSEDGSAAVLIPSKMSEDPGKYMSVSELEREVEAARAREAQLQDKLLELQRRIRSYDNVRT